MKKITTFFLLCVFALAANAVPARRGWQTRTQADGTTIEVQQLGDEFYHYTINRDGKRVRLNEAGMYEVVGDAPTPAQAKAHRAAAKAKRNRKATKAEFGYSPYLPPKGVVIMVNYQDKQFKSTTTKAIIDELCNSTNCTVNQYNGVNYGSIAQYFRDQSDGQYNLQLDVYGPITLDNNYAYYGRDWREEGDDRYSGNVIIEACQKMDNEIDFSQYDWNDDGDVDFVYVVYAGKGQADGGDDNTIWPHSYDIEGSRSSGYCTYSENQCIFDGKRVQNYAMSNELSGNSLAGIGIICHEYGHVIGLPDHYDTDYSTNYNDELTPNEWDVMDGGSYNGGIHCPPNYNAWEKAFCGWYTPQNLGSEGQNLEIKAIGTEGWSAFQINASGTQQAVTTNNSTNYYIENRQQQGWDNYIPYHGLLIWKVNYNKDYWVANEPNLTSHGDPHFTLVCSSGTKVGSSNGTGNVFPKGSIKSWNGVSGKPLLNIAESNGVVTLTYIEEPVVPVDPFDVYFSAYGQPFDTIECTGKLVLPEEAPEACSDGRVFVGWCTQASYSSETTAPTFAKAGDDVEEGAHFYAVFANQDGEGSAETTWDLVSNASSLNSGDVLVMACSSKGFTAGDISNQIMVSIESTFSNNQISALGTGTVEFTLGGSAGAWTLRSANGLLGATAVKKVAWNSGTTTWDITISGDDATIQNTKEDYGRFLYNATSPRFTTYTSNASASMLLPQLYRKTGGASYKDYTTKCESGTDIEQAQTKTTCRKFIKDGQLYILRGDAVYTVTGTRVQ